MLLSFETSCHQKNNRLSSNYFCLCVALRYPTNDLQRALQPNVHGLGWPPDLYYIRPPKDTGYYGDLLAYFASVRKN
jgi:hypothetical protein